MTKRISSVAYAVDEMASEENTASAIDLRDPLVFLLGGRERAADEASASACRTRCVPTPRPAVGTAAPSMPGASSDQHATRPVSTAASAHDPSHCGNLTRSVCGRACRVVASGASHVGGRRPSCTSSSSGAAGWAASSPARSSSPVTPSRSSTRTDAPSGACPPTSAARPIVGFGFDRDHLAEAGIERGRCVRVGDERRQLQHPVRPHRARDLRDRARRRPHLRPAPRAHLPTARHPDGRDRRVDDRPGAAAAAAGRDPPRLGRPDRPGRPRRAPDPAQGRRPEARPAQPARPLLAHRGHAVRARRRSSPAT